jgi:ABC-type Fe3+ transport system substrate-binding protein
MKKIYVWGIAALLHLAVLPGAPLAAPAKSPSGGDKQAWQGEWDKTLKAAKTEGKVVMYTTAGADIRTAFTRIMKDKYGLNMDFVTGKGASMSAKVLSERQAGLYLGDVYLAGGTSTMVNLVPEGVMDPITPEFILPEVGDASKWYGKKLPYIDDKQQLLGFRGSVFWGFTINTTQIKPAELTSFNDLLKPAFKGKIAMGDPTIEGAGNSFTTLVHAYLMGPDYIKKFIKQEPYLNRNERLLTEWVARGKYSILIGTKPDPITEFMKAGAPLLPVIPKEGSMLEPGAGTISVMNKRPHPNATRIFINWLLSKEGQTVYAELAGTESAREDVSKAHLAKDLVREPGKKYVFGDEDFRAAASKTMMELRPLFNALQK